MHNRIIVLSLLLALPLISHTQIEVAEEEVPVYEDNSIIDKAVKEPRIPKHLKTGKPQKYCNSKRHCGFILNDSILIPIEYRSIDSKYSDFILANKNNSWGALNKKGETVLPFMYSSLRRSPANTLLAHDRIFYGLIDYWGHPLVPFEYRRGHVFKDSIAIFQSEFREEKTGKQLIINILSDFKIRVLFESNYQSVERNVLDRILKVKKNDRFGLVDFENKALLPIGYEEIRGINKENIIVKKDGQYGVVNFKNEVVLPFTFNQIYSKNNYLFAQNTDKKQGLFDYKGNKILELEYSNIQTVTAIENLFKIKNEKNVGLANFEGKIVVPTKYGEIYSFEYPVIRWAEGDRGFSIVRDEKKRGLLHKIRALDSDKLGIYHVELGEICPPAYDRVEFLNDKGPYIVYKENLCALMDTTGRILTDFNYKSFILQRQNPYLYLVYDAKDKKRIFNWNNKQFNTNVYDDVRRFQDNSSAYFFSKIGKKYAVHAPNGKEITPHVYDNFALNNKGAEDKITLDVDRFIVIVAMNRTKEGSYEYIAIDDKGKEYPFEKD